MEKTHILMFAIAAFALTGASPVFATIDSYDSGYVTWTTGEQIFQVTLDGTCGERTHTVLVFSYFYDYVHVYAFENGESNGQRAWNYEQFNEVMPQLINEVAFC